MDELQWLASVDPAAMLEAGKGWIREPPSGPPIKLLMSDRKMRLFACACCRQVWDRLTGGPCQDCGGKGRIYDSKVRDEGTYLICPTCDGHARINPSRNAVLVAERFADGLATQQEIDASFHTALAVHPSAVAVVNPLAVMSNLTTVTCSGVSWVDAEFTRTAELAGVTTAVQAALLRDIFGNPYKESYFWQDGKLYAPGPYNFGLGDASP